MKASCNVHEQTDGGHTALDLVSSSDFFIFTQALLVQTSSVLLLQSRSQACETLAASAPNSEAFVVASSHCNSGRLVSSLAFCNSPFA